MICRKCGKTIPAKDRHCVYCGASTGFLLTRLFERLPRRIMVLILVVAVAGLTTVIYLLLTQTQQKVLEFFGEIYRGAADYQEELVIYSEYVTSEAPNIDGMLTTGEWVDSAMTIECNLRERKTSTYYSGEISFYYMNDNDYLYIAIALSSLKPGDISFDKEGIVFNCQVIFDGDNDGFPVPGDDAKILDSTKRSSLQGFGDCYINSEGYVIWGDAQQDGDGAYGYIKNTSTWIGEFRIPLNSGDPQDIKVQPGDTIGIRWFISAYQINSGDVLSGIGSVEWPLWMGPTVWIGDLYRAGGPPPCRSLVLASGPE